MIRECVEVAMCGCTATYTELQYFGSENDDNDALVRECVLNKNNFILFIYLSYVQLSIRACVCCVIIIVSNENFFPL